MQTPSINIPSALLLLGALQNIALATALVAIRKGSKIANRILAGLLLVFSVTLIDGFLFDSRYYFSYPHLFHAGSPFSFLLGPLIYFYVIALTSPGGFRFKWGLLMHLIPFGMNTVLSVPFYFLSADEKIRMLTTLIDKLGKNSSFSLAPFLLILVTQMAAYLIASLRLIVVYSTKIKTGFSSLAKINLSWLRDVYLALFTLWCVFCFASVYAPRHGIYFESMTALRLMIAVLIFALGVRGLFRPQIFNASDVLLAIEDAPAADAETSKGGKQSLRQLRLRIIIRGHKDAARMNDVKQPPPENGDKDKYRKSLLSEEQTTDILRRLTETMEKDRPYLEPELTLPELSKRLSVSPNHLSQVINGRLNKTFFDYINEYRVEEAKRLLVSPEARHLSILGIATDAGFNSKNAFYQAFRKNTGMNPSKFREQHTRREQ
jgi:AraC-like DNA-binding protein